MTFAAGLAKLLVALVVVVIVAVPDCGDVGVAAVLL